MPGAEAGAGPGAGPGGAGPGAGGTPRSGEYLDRWSALHGGADPRGNAVVRGWLLGAHALARPLAAAGVPPAALTAAALATAALVPLAAAAGGRWALLVPAAVVLAGVLDSLDGAVAVTTGRTSAWGAVLDATGDRLADALLLGALALLGAPPWVVLAAVAVAWLHEYVRARAQGTGWSDVGVISVAERPTRLVLVAVAGLAAGLYPGAAAGWATAGAAAALAVGVVGLAQLLVAVRRGLRGRS